MHGTHLRGHLDRHTVLSHEKDVYAYDHSSNSEGVGGLSENLLVEACTPIERAWIHVRREALTI